LLLDGPARQRAYVVTPDGAQPGGYLVTFTITWRQLFERMHPWVCVVARSGAVALRSETGDMIP